MYRVAKWRDNWWSWFYALAVFFALFSRRMRILQDITMHGKILWDHVTKPKQEQVQVLGETQWKSTVSSIPERCLDSFVVFITHSQAIYNILRIHFISFHDRSGIVHILHKPAVHRKWTYFESMIPIVFYFL